jgi:hypothetical protein
MTSHRPRATLAARPGWLAFVTTFALAFVVPRMAHADPDEPETLSGAKFIWNAERTELSVSLKFRRVVDADIRRKLIRGLPTTILLAGTLYANTSDQVLATTAQSCKVTWHVWHEAYRIELTRPNGSRTGWTTTLEGVLRRCAEAQGLLVASVEQVGPDVSVRLEGTVQVNPVSEDTLRQLKQWVSRPLRTGTAAPCDALFSTFTGLFMRRIGEAERALTFVVPPVVPTITPRRRDES